MKKLISAVLFFLPLVALAEVESVGFLGVVGKDLDDAMKAAAGVEHGILVESVTEDSPAEKAGIAVGDIILQINDNKIKSFSELRDLIEEMPDQKANIFIYRSGKRITKTATLGHRDKKKLKFEIDIPDLSELKEVLHRSDETLKKEMEDLKAALENLKVQIEDLKKQIEQNK
jgi:C-terminal processing protease CtpA/Prc